MMYWCESEVSGGLPRNSQGFRGRVGVRPVQRRVPDLFGRTPKDGSGAGSGRILAGFGFAGFGFGF